MNILVVNDDGINSQGLISLAKSLKALAKVTIVAPAKQQSAVGHALTIDNPLRAKRENIDDDIIAYSVNGTPSDCAKLALSSLLNEKPDLLISGINYGRNTSVNILYSGTVAAAAEGMLAGVRSIAVSLDSFSLDSDMQIASVHTTKIISQIQELDFDNNTFLNINIPNLPIGKIKGIRITKMSDSYWTDKYEKRKDPFGRSYFWFAGEFNSKKDGLETDDSALDNGYISITPIHFNFTNSKFIDILKNQNITIENI